MIYNLIVSSYKKRARGIDLTYLFSGDTLLDIRLNLLES